MPRQHRNPHVTFCVSIGYWTTDGGVLIVKDPSVYTSETAACRAARFAAFSAGFACVDRYVPVEGAPSLTREEPVCSYARPTRLRRPVRTAYTGEGV